MKGRKQHAATDTAVEPYLGVWCEFCERVRHTLGGGEAESMRLSAPDILPPCGEAQVNARDQRLLAGSGMCRVTAGRCRRALGAENVGIQSY